jgi:hypothetical protein
VTNFVFRDGGRNVSIKTPPKIASKFGVHTRKAMEALPVRTIFIETDAPLGSNAFDEAVRLACLKSKQAEQAELQDKKNASSDIE